MFDNANVVASGIFKGRFDTTLLHLGFEQLGNAPVVTCLTCYVPKYL